MKTLSQLLLIEQKKALKKPVFELQVSPFTKPDPCATVQWSLFGWEKIYSDSTTLSRHGAAVPMDGSLNRVRISGSTVYHQRVASPGTGSTWTDWTDLSGSIGAAVVAISASLSSSEVIIFSQYGGYLCYRQSTDNGQTFGDWTAIGTVVADKCLAACHKSDTEMAVIFVSNSDNVLSLVKRNSSMAWSSAVYTLSGSPDIVSLGVYYDGDYNIIALVNRGGIHSLARIVFGQGYRVAENNWSDVVYLNLASASIDSVDLVNQYVENLPPYSDFATARYEYEMKTFNPRTMSRRELQAWAQAHGWSYFEINEVLRGNGCWKAIDSLTLARATDNLDLDAPFVCKPPGQPALLSFIRTGERWTYRLRPATDFYDAGWSKAYKQGLSTVYGLALSCDGSHIWGTRNNEVWRMPVPGALQIPPANSGGEGTPVSIPWGDILKVQETIKPSATSELYIEMDNTDKSYLHGSGETINKGYLVRLKYGYAGRGENLLSPGQVYFIEDITYSRSANRSSVILHCIDAWGLLEHFAIPAPAEVNYAGDEYSVYELAEKLLQCIGGTLSYRSRSTAMTDLYPRMSIKAGESAAGVLKRLLDLVPDVIIIDGLNAIIIYPQETDLNVYTFYFPERG